jgi:hypothetical protein
MRLARSLGAATAVLLLTVMAPGSLAQAQNTIAPNDPKLIARTNQVCLSAALTSGGLDQQTKSFCQCAAPVLSRHMTPESRYRLLVQNRTDVRPDYDDPNATANDVLKACPPVKP